MKLRLIPILLLVSLLSCTRAPQPEEDEGLVTFSLDTKAADPSYAGTFRVALFNGSAAFTGRTGSYCTEKFADARNWLMPCKVNANGEPLDATDPGAVVANLADADHSGKWGLRWTGDGTQGAWPASLIAVSPAVPIRQDDVYAYVEWTPDQALYISDPPASNGTFSGSWMDNQQVYTASAKIPELIDHRASVTVKIVCGQLDKGSVQHVAVTHWIKSDRYYLRGTAAETIKQGFSLMNTPAANRHFEFNAVDEQIVLFDYATDGGVKYLAKTPGAGEVESWISARKVYFPAFNFADENLDDSLRPVITVKLGSDTSNPIIARVVLNQKLDPMKNYIYTLFLSKAHIALQLTVSSWGANPEMDAGLADPISLGSIALGSGDAWDEDSDLNAGGWKE